HVAAADDQDLLEHSAPCGHRATCSTARRLLRAARALRLAGRIDQGRVERIARLLVAPQHELERGVEPVALGNRALYRKLRHRQAEQPVFAEHQSVAVEQDAAVRPDVEMTEPELL